MLEDNIKKLNKDIDYYTKIITKFDNFIKFIKEIGNTKLADLPNFRVVNEVKIKKVIEDIIKHCSIDKFHEFKQKSHGLEREVMQAIKCHSKNLGNHHKIHSKLQKNPTALQSVEVSNRLISKVNV